MRVDTRLAAAPLSGAGPRSLPAGGVFTLGAEAVRVPTSAGGAVPLAGLDVSAAAAARDAEFAAIAADVVDEVQGELIDLLSALGSGRRAEVAPIRSDRPPAASGERIRTADVADMLRELAAVERLLGSTESVRRVD